MNRNEQEGNSKLGSEAGTVTIEIALVLPVVVLLLVTVLTTLSIANTRAHIQDQARQVARLASTGLSLTEMKPNLDLGKSRINITTQPPLAIIQVTQTVHVGGLFDMGITLNAESVTYLEEYVGRDQ